MASNFTPKHAVKVGLPAASYRAKVCGKVLKIGGVKGKRGKFATLEAVTATGRNKNVSVTELVGVPVR